MLERREVGRVHPPLLIHRIDVLNAPPTTVREFGHTDVTEDFQNPCTGVTGTATLELHEFATKELDPETHTRDFVGKRLKNVIKNDVLKVNIEKDSLSCG